MCLHSVNRDDCVDSEESSLLSIMLEDCTDGGKSSWLNMSSGMLRHDSYVPAVAWDTVSFFIPPLEKCLLLFCEGVSELARCLAFGDLDSTHQLSSMNQSVIFHCIMQSTPGYSMAASKILCCLFGAST